MEEKEDYGFVYIWYDKKHKRYYIGCHWGNTEDGYICGSKWMKKSHKRRPTDFTRRILKIVYDRKTLLDEEYSWLSKIKDNELGKKYYNLTKHHNGHWSTDLKRKETIGQKISKANKGRAPGIPKGSILSEETKKKISSSTSKAMIEYYRKNPRTEKTRKKISENSKKAQAEHRIGMHGKKHTEETIQKMKINNAMNNPEHRLKISQAKKGIKWLSNDIDKKMAVPGTDKFFNLINEGYRVI